MKKLYMVLLLLFLGLNVFPTAYVHAEEAESVQTNLIWKIYGIEKVETQFLDLRFLYEDKKDESQNKVKTAKDSSIEVSKEEKKLLARLVHAEAKGEPYDGKVAVAEVVLNRVEHEEFPDTVKEVIYEENAFQPVQNGAINKPADKEAMKAVQEAIVDQESNEDVLYFYNPETATSDWIFTRKVVKKIGNHAFAI